MTWSCILHLLGLTFPYRTLWPTTLQKYTKGRPGLPVANNLHDYAVQFIDVEIYTTGLAAKKKKNVFWKQQICRKPSIRHFLLLAPFQTRNGRKRVVKGNRTGSPFLATPSPPFFSLLVGIFACPKLCESLEQATLKLSFHISFKEVRKGF